MTVPTIQEQRAQRDARTATLLGRLPTATLASDRARILERAVALNLELADALAHRYRLSGEDADDLIQVARYGLLLALVRFDPAAGHLFSAFAVPTILGELRRHFRDGCWAIRPPRRLVELRGEIARTRAELEQARRSTPSPAAIAAALDVPIEAVGQALKIESCFQPDSLETHGPAPVGYPPDPEDAIGALVEHLALEAAVAGLTPKDRALLRWRFVDRLTQQEIAERLDVSQMQVSRLLRRVLATLRARLEPDAPLRRAG